MRIGILTGGGDAPGLNAAIRAATRRALLEGHLVCGIRNGWAGALDGSVEDLTPMRVRGILPQGGTILGTSRTNPLKVQDGIATVGRVLHDHAIDALIAMGGDDTLSVAVALHEAGCRVVGVPKTIDNDLSGTEFCIGFDTAVGIVTEALDRLHTTASAHHRVMVVEVMGRDVGWVATMGGLAGGADVVLVPEVPADLAQLVDHLRRRWAEGKQFSIVVVAEGVTFAKGEEDAAETDAFGHVRLARRGIGDALSGYLEQVTGFETRATVLGHLQRGGTPSALDRIWATRLGVRAAELVMEGRSGVVPVRRGGEVAVVPIAELTEKRRVPQELFELTRVFG
jgi:phosphofructokinase-like protein